MPTRLRTRSLGTADLELEEGFITGSLDHRDFGGDGDGDGDGDSDSVAVTKANGASEDFPANAIPLEVFIYLDTAFSGGTINSAVVTVGDAGNPDQIFGETPVNVFTGAGTGWKFATGDDNAADGARSFETAYAPVVTITTGAEPPAGLTAGKLRYGIRYLRLVSR